MHFQEVAYGSFWGGTSTQVGKVYESRAETHERFYMIEVHRHRFARLARKVPFEKCKHWRKVCVRSAKDQIGDSIYSKIKVVQVRKRRNTTCHILYSCRISGVSVFCHYPLSSNCRSQSVGTWWKQTGPDHCPDPLAILAGISGLVSAFGMLTLMKQRQHVCGWHKMVPRPVATLTRLPGKVAVKECWNGWRAMVFPGPGTSHWSRKHPSKIWWSNPPVFSSAMRRFEGGHVGVSKSYLYERVAEINFHGPDFTFGSWNRWGLQAEGRMLISLPVPISIICRTWKKMLLAQVISHSMTISLPLGQHTREVDTNDGDVPSDDLLPAKSQTSRAKSGDASRVVWGCKSWSSLSPRLAKCSILLSEQMFHSNFSANFRCCERYHGCLATFDSLAPLPGGLSQGLRQFTRSARKQDLDRALVAAIVSKQVWHRSEGFRSWKLNLLQEARFNIYRLLIAAFFELGRIWDHSKLLSSHCIEWLNSRDWPNLFFQSSFQPAVLAPDDL